MSVQVAQLEEYMKTLDTNLAPLSEALGTMMECNEVTDMQADASIASYSPALVPAPISRLKCSMAYPVLGFLTTNTVDSIPPGIRGTSPGTPPRRRPPPEDPKGRCSQPR